MKFISYNKSCCLTFILTLASTNDIVFAQCGALPQKAIDATIKRLDLPTVFSHVGVPPANLLPPNNFPLSQVIGSLDNKYQDLLHHVSYRELGRPRNETEVVAITAHLDYTECNEDIITTVTATTSANINELWGIQSTISTSAAIELGIEVGLAKSVTGASVGLSSSSSWSQSTAYNNTVSASIGSGIAISRDNVAIRPCHEYRVGKTVKVQDYFVTASYHMNVFVIDAYLDQNNNGVWDHLIDGRALWSISCGGPLNDGRPFTVTGSATVISSSNVRIDWLGDFPVDEGCPCACVEGQPNYPDCLNPGGGGGGDLDDDGTLDRDDPDIDGDGTDNNDDSDIDGDGIGNDHDDDTDGDGIPNSQDTDDDNDGIPDSEDDSPHGTDENDDIDGDGIPNGEDGDIDGDGIDNEDDDDMDGDGVPNDEDGDMDGDGILNEDDDDDNANGIPDDEENTWPNLIDVIKDIIDDIRDWIDQLF